MVEYFIVSRAKGNVDDFEIQKWTKKYKINFWPKNGKTTVFFVFILMFIVIKKILLLYTILREIFIRFKGPFNLKKRC